MKSFLLSFLFTCSGSLIFAQSSKVVSWNYAVKKVADKTYEVHMTAEIDGDYHLYAQNVGVDGPVPTSFTFNKNRLIVLDGAVKESGKKVKKLEPIWGGNVNYYEKTVTFVQTVKLKANVKTSFAGKVNFMVCDEKECLPPADVNIKVSVGG